MYRKLEGVVLKKQNYKEADQIITLWTKEVGKVRVLAKAIRSNKSRLAYSVQDLSLVEIETAGKNLGVLTSAKQKKTYKAIRKDLSKIGLGFYATELVMKMTADEQANGPAYSYLLEFLDYLDKAQNLKQAELAVFGFALKLMECLGFSIEFAHNTMKIERSLTVHLNKLVKEKFDHVERLSFEDDLANKITKTIKDFIEFILERELKTEKIWMMIKSQIKRQKVNCRKRFRPQMVLISGNL